MTWQLAELRGIPGVSGSSFLLQETIAMATVAAIIVVFHRITIFLVNLETVNNEFDNNEKAFFDIDGFVSCCRLLHKRMETPL